MRKAYNRRYKNNKASFRAFAQRFSKALKEHSEDDHTMKEQGKLISDLLKKYESLDRKAHDYHVKAKLTNVSKNEVRRETVEKIANTIQYLEFKYGKNSRKLLDFGVSPWKRGRPRKRVKCDESSNSHLSNPDK